MPAARARARASDDEVKLPFLVLEHLSSFKSIRVLGGGEESRTAETVVAARHRAGVPHAIRNAIDMPVTALFAVLHLCPTGPTLVRPKWVH